MYYSNRCSYCSKLFYTYQPTRQAAARVLFEKIKAHQIEYDEDRKDFQLDEDPDIEVNQMYEAVAESEERPVGGYEV